MKQLKNKVKGCLLVLFALLLAASELGYLGSFNFISWGIFLVLVYCLLSNLMKRKFIVAGLWAPITYYFGQSLFALPEISIWMSLIISIILAWGLSMIFEKNKSHHFTYNNNQQYSKRESSDRSNFEFSWDSNVDPIIDQDVENIDKKKYFEASSTYLYTDDFDAKTIHCNLSAIEIYFRQGNITKDSVRLNINGKMCAIELHVPRNWRVIIDMDYEGTVIENYPYDTQSDFILYLGGNCKFSAIEINYN